MGIQELTAGATMGYDIYYSADGENFDALTKDGFGHPESYGLRTFLRADDALFFTTSGPYNGFEVWKLRTEADQYNLTIGFEI
ncbi:hypothetical protein [Radiobacillus sp. PE A8.2]|uniref:hypothetical protein n=1 Tax=Radiobacillus sp. PE A8.2 TaxID=3380349 RepID=UPI00388F257C